MATADGTKNNRHGSAEPFAELLYGLREEVTRIYGRKHSN